MLNKVYRLISPKQFEAVMVEENITKDTVIIKPTFLSICHADQRYYTGSRDKIILRKKLPMALIHEGIGVIVKDFSGTFKKGERVIIVPNTPFESDKYIQENYLPSSKFRSSGYDGLMQEYVFARKDRIVRLLDSIPSNVAAYTELISVAFHGIKKMNKVMNEDHETFGIWGDGNLGYIVANLLKGLYPESRIFIFGKNEEKLSFFSFADETFTIDSIPEDLKISQAFECVGGIGSYHALKQIIKFIKPQGAIGIMGVSESPIEIETRMVLEKGLTISGTSRSGIKDFEDTIQFLATHPRESKRFENLVGIEKEIKDIDDIHDFFEADLANSWGKAVMNWKL